MAFIIRNAGISDFAAVRRIMNQVQQMHVDWRPDVYKPNENLITEEAYRQMVGSGNLFVADEDGKAVGVLEVVYKHVENPSHVTRDVVFIESMAVDADYRGQGIGHLFFEKVKELKETSHADGIELQVNAKNRAAYEMYRNYGFTEKSINMELL